MSQTNATIANEKLSRVTLSCSDDAGEDGILDDRLLLIRNELYGLATRYESSNIPIYSFLNRLILLFQSSAIFVFCWKEKVPDRWRLFHNFYDPIARPLFDQFLTDLLSGAMGEQRESTAELFCPIDAFDSVSCATKPIRLPLQKRFYIFLAGFKKLPDNKISENNVKDYFEVFSERDSRYRSVQSLFNCLERDENVTLSRFVFGENGARLEKAVEDFVERHRVVNMDPRGGASEIAPAVAEDDVEAVLDEIRSKVVGPILADVRPSPLIQYSPSAEDPLGDIDCSALPFANLFFVVRVPYDNNTQFRYSNTDEKSHKGIPYTLKYLITDSQRSRIRSHYHKLASIGGCKHNDESGFCGLHENKCHCILDICPGVFENRKESWAWSKTVRECEKDRDGVNSIVDLVEQRFGDDYRSIIDTAIALGTIFFGETLSPDGLSRGHSESADYSQPIALSRDKLRFYATCCLFQQITDRRDARLVAIPIQVGGTHYACAVSIVRKNDFSDIAWFRTFHFYTMIMSRVVMRKFRRDLRDFYLNLIQEHLVERCGEELSDNKKRSIVKDGTKTYLGVNIYAICKDTSKYIEILTRRIPFKKVILRGRPFSGHENNKVVMTVRGQDLTFYFKMEDDKHFPKIRAPINKRHFLPAERDKNIPGAYLSEKHVKVMLERAVDRMTTLLNSYFDAVDKMKGEK